MAAQRFLKILVANRGEIAVRIERACADMGISSIAIASVADADAIHASLATETVAIGGSAAKDSYLDVDRIVEVAVSCGVDAVHPGYGFLAENAEFADAVVAAGIRFIGPPGEVMRALGDKRTARNLAAEAGLPVLPGHHLADDDDIMAVAETVGYPLVVKAAHGGGGRGIRFVDSVESLSAAVDGARNESRLAFGRDDVFIERRVLDARHVEVQILADEHGTVIHLGTRDCSTQRRHQKLVEEAPASSIPAGVAKAITSAACQIAESVGYVGAGTVEFLVDGVSNEFYFLEVNTRLQVEHTVTELITGVDIVAAQILVASGEPLGISQSDVTFRGHAIQTRINAEDPANGFMPSTGRLERLRLPSGPWVRCDCGVDQGSTITPFYDSLIAKVIVWGPDRASSRDRLARALAELSIEGLPTTAAYLQLLIRHPTFLAGAVTTGFVDGGAIDLGLLPQAYGDLANADSVVEIHSDPVGAVVTSERDLSIATTSGALWLKVPFSASSGGAVSAVSAVSAAPDITTTGRATTRNEIRGAGAFAPMDGVLARFSVAVGDPVEPNTTVAIVESMKMETDVKAGSHGTVRCLLASVGDPIRRGVPLVQIEESTNADG